MSNIITVDTPVVLTTTVDADKLDPSVLMQFLSLGERREEFIKELVHASPSLCHHATTKPRYLRGYDHH